MKNYGLKEMFLTLQGEGTHAGELAVFIRFTGCNLWNGKDTPEDRAKGKGACARWCDTDFFSGKPLSAGEIAEQAAALWDAPHIEEHEPLVVLTGGEPLLQVDIGFIGALRRAFINKHHTAVMLAVETNGTVFDEAALFGDPENIDPTYRTNDDPIDFVACAPKVGGDVVIPYANEVKVVLGIHEQNFTMDDVKRMQDQLTADRVFLQPLDPSFRGGGLVIAQRLEEYKRNVELCMQYAKRNPSWTVGLQAHKVWGLR